MNRSGSSEVRVSIAMPNEGDLDIMNEAVEKCKYFGVSYEVMVTSVHLQMRWYGMQEDYRLEGYK